jgi:uncharacterized repeat protein (TIGR03843 family)
MENLDLLLNGEIEIEGLIPDSSNGALKVLVSNSKQSVEAIIKPEVSIRPLWDFPDLDLNNREYATYLLDRELNLNYVPDTVMRNVEGIGKSLIQEWVTESDNDLIIVKSPEDIPEEYLKVLQGYDELNKLITLAHKNNRDLRNLCLFDLVINNADRKGGHLLMDSANKMWAIDHGVSWHFESKIRTVLWGWIDETFNDQDIALLNNAKKVIQTWKEEEFIYLSKEEIEQAIKRVEGLLKENAFPQPGDQWPAVPWPIF